MTREVISASDALQILKEGNQRFLQYRLNNTDLPEQIKQTAEGQFPFAAILGCVDSRTPAELIFDLSLGDIINIRVAGNVVNDDVLGSLEYACAVANVMLILVLGHTRCGAVESACDSFKMGKISGVLEKIQPAINAENKIQSERNGKNIPFTNNVSMLNVKNSMKMITKESEVLKHMLEKGDIGLVGAVYDVGTGKLTFLED